MERFGILAALVVPLFVALVGWPWFTNAIGGSSSQATRTIEVQGAQIRATGTPVPTLTPTPNAPARTATPLSSTRREPDQTLGRPTPPATLPAAARTATAPGAQPGPGRDQPAAAPTSGAGPAQVVASFYQLAGAHQFDAATQLWSPGMQSRFPPAQNVTQRFSGTQRLDVRRADVVAVDEAAGRATVAVDVVEVGADGRQTNFVGTWQLVRGPAGWQLNQPDLRPAQ